MQDPGVGQDEVLARLAAQLEDADALDLDGRLTLLGDTEAAISRSLEGLDGL